MPKRPKKPKKQDVANRFLIRYGADFLQHVGPYVGAGWAVPPALETELRRQQKPVPAPVSGYLLLDTGAEKTCISMAAARKLELKPIAKVKGFGAGGEHTFDLVFARLQITILDHRGITTSIWWDQPAQCVPDLEKHPQGRGVTIQDKPVELVGLLGRDILRLTTIIYNGREGKLQVTFDRDWIRSRDASASK